MGKAIQGYMDSLAIERGDAAFNTVALLVAIINAAVVGVEQVIWEMTVPAQTKFRWGYGTPELPMNQGTCLYVTLDLTTAYDEGILHLCCQNAPRTDLRYVKSMDDENLHSWDAGFTLPLSLIYNKETLIALPEIGPMVKHNSRMVLRYIPRVLTGATDGASFFLPVTSYIGE